MQWLQQTLGLADYDGVSSVKLKAPIPKETLLQFFSQCKAQFVDPGFKGLLSAAVAGGKDPQDVINDMQRLVWKGLDVEENRGMAFLGKIKATYGDDAQLMVAFMDMVSREEMALDEAELAPQEFQRRQQLSMRMQEAMQASAGQLQGMSAEQQRAHVAQVYQRVMQEQAMQQNATDPTQGGAVLSTDEQMAFFASLQNGCGPAFNMGGSGLDVMRRVSGSDTYSRPAAGQHSCCSSHGCSMQHH